MALTKKEMAVKIANELGENTKSVEQVINLFLATVKEETLKGERVRLKGFGSFIVRTNAERTINPFGKGERTVPEAKKVRFTPSKEFNA